MNDMDRFVLTRLSIQDFRGQTREVVFNPRVNRIVGTNGVGKSTLFEAFHWLFIGTDSLDRMNYDLFDNRREYTHENAIPAIVEAYVEKNGEESSFKRVAKQKWTRPRNQAEYVKASTDEYKFYVNGLEVTATAYKSMVVDFFGCDIEKLKFILNIRYFRLLNWKDLRKHFADLVGEVRESDYKGNYSNIQTYLSKYGVEGAKDFFRQQIRPLKSQLDDIDADIKAKEGCLPDLTAVAQAEELICEKREVMAGIQSQILGLSDANKPFVDKRDAELARINELRSDIKAKELERDAKIRKVVDGLQTCIANIERDNARIDADIEAYNRDRERQSREINLAKEDLAGMLKEYELLKKANLDIKSRVMDETCPVCGSFFSGEKLERLRAEFNRKNEAERAPIVERGKHIASRIETQKARIEELEKAYAQSADKDFPAKMTTAAYYAEISEVMKTPEYKDSDEGKAALAFIEELEANLTVVPEANSKELMAQSEVLMTEIEDLAKVVSMREIHATLTKQIAAKRDERHNTVVELAKWEGLLESIVSREREWAEIIRERSGKYFDRIRVEMLERDKSGKFIDICSVSIDGVDVGVTNSANKFIAGIDISNGFSRKYGVCLPLFLDDRERVVSDLSELTGDRQIISLEVNKDYPELTKL